MIANPLACSPFMPRPRANRPCESRHLPVRGLSLHVRHWPGEAGPLRVILHGWMDVSGTFARLVEELPDDWAVAAPDQRGFGLSDWGGDTYWFYDYVADLDGLLEQLSPGQPVDLIGHSMGSQVAALYAGTRPDRVRRLVAMDGFYLPVTPADKAPGRLRRWLENLREPIARKEYTSLEDLAERIARRQPGLDADGARFVAECWSRPLADGRRQLLGDPRHRQAGPLLYRDEEARAIFRQVTAPTLILDAERSYLDSLCPAEVRQARLDCFTRHEQAVVANAGHMLHFDAPGATAKHIAEFLDGEPQARDKRVTE